MKNNVYELYEFLKELVENGDLKEDRDTYIIMADGGEQTFMHEFSFDDGDTLMLWQ